MLRKLSAWGERHPMLFGVVATSVKHSVADLFAQMVVEDRSLDEVNFRRNALYFVYGIFVAYNNSIPSLLVPRMLPHLQHWAKLPLRQKIRDRRGCFQAAINIAVDNFLTTPIIYFPSYYILCEFLMGSSSSCCCFANGLTKYRHACVDDLVTLWKVWVPIGFLTFTVVPIHMRVPWISGVGFFWTVFFSFWKSGSTERLSEGLQQGALREADLRSITA
jgi:protein Mpv17